MQKPQVQKFESENQFFKTSVDRQDFFLVNDGAVWQMFPYIGVENAIYSEGGSSVPDVMVVNLGAGRGVEIQGRGILRVLHAFQSRQLVSLSLGETKDMAVFAIEVIHNEPARQRDPQGAS